MSTVIVDVVRLAVAAILLFAGSAKLVNPHPLARGLSVTFGWARALPGGGTYVARGIAAVELVASFLVASGWLLPAGLTLAGGLGVGIVVFTVIAVSRGRRVPCGCFGESGKPIGLSNALAGTALVVATITIMTYRGSAADERPALLLTLTVVLTVGAVLVRHRSALVRPFGRHFRTFTR